MLEFINTSEDTDFDQRPLPPPLPHLAASSADGGQEDYEDDFEDYEEDDEDDEVWRETLKTLGLCCYSLASKNVGKYVYNRMG